MEEKSKTVETKTEIESLKEEIAKLQQQNELIIKRYRKLSELYNAIIERYLSE